MADNNALNDLICEKVVYYFSTIDSDTPSSAIHDFSEKMPIGLLDGSFVFSLEGLYCELCSTNSFFDNEVNDYTVFRKAIYSTNINQQLAKLGCHITVYQSSGKLDKNLYQLVSTV